MPYLHFIFFLLKYIWQKMEAVCLKDSLRLENVKLWLYLETPFGIFHKSLHTFVLQCVYVKTLPYP